MSRHVEEARRLLELEQPGPALEALERAAAAADDPQTACAVARHLSLCAGETGMQRVAERLLTAHPYEVEVVVRVSAALNRAAELRPADEPPFAQGPAHLAAGATQRCFDALDPASRQDPEQGGYLQINLADALRMMGPDCDEDARAAYALALAIDDRRGGWWFNLGLLHKWRGRFQAGLEANQKALARMGEVRAVLWNLAICATALGDGERACASWRKLGMSAELSSANMPYVPGLPPAKIRVASVGEELGANDPLPQKSVGFEVLSVQPLSPCHGVVQTPSVRRAAVDYGDLVLFDGAPVRLLEQAGQRIPCFPLLWILRPGDERRFRFIGMQRKPGLLEALGRDLPDGVQLFPCDRRRGGSAADELFYGKLVISADRDLSAARLRLESGIQGRPGLTLAVPGLLEALGDTPAAGKAHQVWGGLERAAQRAGSLPA